MKGLNRELDLLVHVPSYTEPVMNILNRRITYVPSLRANPV